MSTLDTIGHDMRYAGCNPVLVADIEHVLEHVSNSRQRTFLLMTHGYSESEIGRALGKSQPTISRYVYSLRTSMASLLDPSYA
jgi:DNA-directed RNA polymerase specialized sigma24 family protein